jgi:hypothetical protein
MSPIQTSSHKYKYQERVKNTMRGATKVERKEAAEQIEGFSSRQSERLAEEL